MGIGFAKEVGFKPGVKEKERELWMLTAFNLLFCLLAYIL